MCYMKGVRLTSIVAHTLLPLAIRNSRGSLTLLSLGDYRKLNVPLQYVLYLQTEH